MLPGCSLTPGAVAFTRPARRDSLLKKVPAPIIQNARDDCCGGQTYPKESETRWSFRPSGICNTSSASVPRVGHSHSQPERQQQQPAVWDNSVCLCAFPYHQGGAWGEAPPAHERPIYHQDRGNTLDLAHGAIPPHPSAIFLPVSMPHAALRKIGGDAES